jgi:hypothetical protein
MVEVLLKTMQRLCDCTVLQRHRDIKKLSATWAGCFEMVEVLLKTMQGKGF